MVAEPFPLVALDYVDAKGWNPFLDWKKELDADARAIVEVRISRLRLGNWGDWRSVGDGVAEARIHHGPGYRIYIGRQGHEAIILLGGGDKRTQAKDILVAKARWADFIRRSRETRR
jgi:putative addiction module killer protein